MIRLCTTICGVKYYFFLITVAISLGASCVRSKGKLYGSVFRTSDTEYRIGDLPQSWKRISLKKADLAYVNSVDGSTLLINSECSETDDTPLLALSYHLVIGMTELSIIGRKTIPIARREALETTAEAKIDGVKRKMQILVLKKDACVYDIVFSAFPENFADNLGVYETVLKGFDVPGKKT